MNVSEWKGPAYIKWLETRSQNRILMRTRVNDLPAVWPTAYVEVHFNAIRAGNSLKDASRLRTWANLTILVVSEGARGPDLLFALYYRLQNWSYIYLPFSKSTARGISIIQKPADKAKSNIPHVPYPRTHPHS
jgi:hypothetical protein